MKLAYAIAATLLVIGCGAGVVEGDPMLSSQHGSELHGDDDTFVPPGDNGPLPQDDDGAVTDDGPGDSDTDPPPTDDDPPPPAGRVPVLIAQGHMQRTIMSCDGGVSWVANASANDDARCWTDGDPNYVECDHNPGAGRGITFTGTAFVATFGWGPPGGIFRSENGVDWDPRVSGTTFGGVETGAGHVIAMSAVPRISNDDGVTFTTSDDYIDSQARRTGFAAYDGGRFIMVGDGEITLSSDAGSSWWSPDVWPSGCGDNIQTPGGVAFGNGVILVLGGNGLACRSTNGGTTWTTHSTGTNDVGSQLVWNGSVFRMWSGDRMYSSSDGASWSSVAISPSNVRVGIVAYDPEHDSYAAINGGWGDWYATQRFYRSNDGITWETLAAGAAVRSHPMRNMVFGYAKPSAACP